VSTPSDYADELERATAEAIDFAASCTADEWSTIVPGEDWPVGVVVHHVALGYDLVVGWIDCALSGRPIEGGGEHLDADNQRHAEEYAGVGVAETIELLRSHGQAAAARLRGLGESDLATTTPFGPAGGAPFSIEQFCNAAIGHVRGHLGHARSAVRGPAADGPG